MRNVSGRSSPWIEPPRQFRIPHSALRILLLTMLAGAAEAQVDPSGSWRTYFTWIARAEYGVGCSACSAAPPACSRTNISRAG